MTRRARRNVPARLFWRKYGDGKYAAEYEGGAFLIARQGSGAGGAPVRWLVKYHGSASQAPQYVGAFPSLALAKLRAQVTKFTGNPRKRSGSRARYVHKRVRAPSRFVKRSLRTIKAGAKRIIVGHLKGQRRRTKRGRVRQTVQAILTPKRNVSEAAAWKVVLGEARRLSEMASPTCPVAQGAIRLHNIATQMLAQLKVGVHENPHLAIVGANPPMGKVVEIRYRRDRGAHPGYYKHTFKRGHEPAMVALNDGSLKIG